MNDIQTAVQIFMPNEKYKPVDGIQSEGITVKSVLTEENAIAELYENGIRICHRQEPIDEKGFRYALKSAVYHMLKEHNGVYTPPWGMMTGHKAGKKSQHLYGRGTYSKGKRPKAYGYIRNNSAKGRACR